MEKCAIYHAVLGVVGTNVYLLKNKETGEALLIDPADEAEAIDAMCKKAGAVPVAILLTHGHFDHMAAADELAAEKRLPVYAYRGENALMADPAANGSRSLAGFRAVCKADHEVAEGDILELAGFSVRVLHTPGHTAGSCCYYLPEEGILFSGDTLFRGSYGRTDLATGSTAQIIQSVRRLLREIPGDVIVLPGHMGTTTIAFEQKYNPLSETQAW